MKQTSIEWFNQQLVDKQNGKGDLRSWDELIEQAKEMHEQEIIDAYRDGRSDQQSDEGRFYNRNAVYYYNETYNRTIKNQQKRMYSEEEVRKIVWESRKFFHEYKNTPFNKVREVFYEWFEQFKKK